jgi:hypothetical protein
MDRAFVRDVKVLDPGCNKCGQTENAIKEVLKGEYHERY